MFPNTPISARWRLVPADRAIAADRRPAGAAVYVATPGSPGERWRATSSALHWYEGSEAFGRRALAIGEQAVREAADFLGVTETEPIDFFVYAEQAAFYDALGPGTRENVVGTAIAEHPDDVRADRAERRGSDAEVARTVPHELTHLVFNTAVRNPYHSRRAGSTRASRTTSPRGSRPSDRAAVEAAAADGRLMPLRALGGQFPTTYERFVLAYAESVSAVDYLVREKGTDALVQLIRQLRRRRHGRRGVHGRGGHRRGGVRGGLAGGPRRRSPRPGYGPQPAPAGPLPPGWEVGRHAGTPSGVRRPEPLGRPRAPGASAEPGGGSEPRRRDSPFRDGWVLVVAALAGLVVGGSLAYVRRRRARPAAWRGPSAP